MTDEDIVAYREGRLKELMTFYDRKSAHNKRWHRICAAYVIIISAIIPALIGTGAIEKYRLVGSLASGTIVAVTAWAAHAQYHENWLRYRRTWDSLKREESLLLAHAGVYKEADTRHCMFVERVEDLADFEGRDWESRHSPRSASTKIGPKEGC